MTTAADTGSAGRGGGAGRRVAVVGAGPAGFFCADELLRDGAAAACHLFDRSFAPYGLVRHGVAPDHPVTRRVTRMFDLTAARPGFAFFGGVDIGRDLDLAALRRAYDAVIVACGARQDRALGVPGEEFPGVISSMAFAGWANRIPDSAAPDLGAPVAAVVGHGNVALDIVRLLCRPAEFLRGTDIGPEALAALETSAVREIHVIGRRGPAQAAFGPGELEEVGRLEGVAVTADADAFALTDADREELDAPDGVQRQVFGLLQDFAARAPDPAAGRRVHFHFRRAPAAVAGTGRVEGLVLERTRLEGPAWRQKAVGTGERTTLACGLVVKSIGHTGVPFPGLPFDAARGVIPSRSGRVGTRAETVPGVYVCGWIKRGARGLIGHNRRDAIETTDALRQDLPSLPPCPDPSGTELAAALAARGVRPISWADWQRLAAEELRRGAAAGRPRIAFASEAEARAWLREA